ncbi:CDP-diacylglycerol--glycerol-3-phosphate 3-phosphatidyltransferase [Lentilactobacillus parafarraginis]|jgi:CDP-diacylglycerol--glycerol-3-phosphate 3-phosphatidyltransferase|uniref:CDP-diacylglycerol--glycerol-3-phosphate 3-phosphatidyltransferase n=3 Tax=Lentilactobacillus parafarraginis TaxID=390842 RepID=A0A0R1YS61_9LACO|nr:CDP-diacylglycerol--glycerol-3-phosphate 3-phosphatidyltransferase [Lentilactobacillus parafarraginis]EHL95605.1 CDP-diacylglycerol--glycerol-3-phosphate 3-phosphatidyltransferase [Lentilactobacillus parafarraginis F0439]KRM45352.1 CDP-diacylglycerol--glycerol-3-phosphate 3-phosphatidyltransferase [Lentilactobacillus parafarraginis DSM 18390 = JCM 14109]TLQ20070.1 CDP-diacylglycerol--glycerol-3-phosphate 3-phosphatidyltransferase [Lentilactobacillus parafarraginis]
MNLPNKLTLFRIILIPFFILIVAAPILSGSVTIAGTVISNTRWVATLIFIVASLTDFLDGQIARRRHLVTNFGKFADPMADKMLVMTAFIFLVSLNDAPAWVIVIIVCRELAVTGLRLIVVENDGKVVAAAWPGKIKTTTQMLAIIFLLLNNVLFAAINFPFAQLMLYICLFFTIYSGIDYFVQNRSVFADSF